MNVNVFVAAINIVDNYNKIKYLGRILSIRFTTFLVSHFVYLRDF